MGFDPHITEFAGLPILDFPTDPDAPLPDGAAANGPQAWRIDDRFEDFLARVDTNRVAALVTGLRAEESNPADDTVVESLCAHADRFPALRALFVRELTNPITPLLAAFPLLEQLWVRGSAHVAPITHDSLCTLVLQSAGLSPLTARALAECDFPALEHLEFYIGHPDYGGDTAPADFAWLLAGDRLPNLRHLGLRNAPLPKPSLPLRFAIVGNPDNRRVTLFADAVRAAGLPEPRIVPWLDVLRGDYAFEAGELVRVDSPGEDAEVARLLRGSAEPVDMYRVEGTREWYLGFTAVLEKLESAVDDAGAARLFNHQGVAMAFDKLWTYEYLIDVGVPVPDEAETDGSQSAFIKIRHGSSASGVVALTVNGTRRRAVTSVEMVRTETGIELYNSLRVRTYTRDSDIDDLLAALAPDGLHAEAWVPKLKIRGRDCDLRIVTVGTVPTHAVVRTSAFPMTNLHLGGRRGDLAEFRALVGERRWERILDYAGTAAACFPGVHTLGIDILPGADGRDHIGEVNAYGDLLPNLMGLPGTLGEGLDTYGAQVRALIGRFA